MKKQIPNEWEIKRLDEVASVTMGQSPSSSSYNSQGNGVPFLQGMPSVFDGMGTVVPQLWTTEPTKVVGAGTALMTVRAPVGELFTTNNPICLGRGLAGVKANNDVSQIYLNYYLQFSKKQLNTYSQGSTFTAINSDSLKGIPVALPSSTQQEYIGNVLITIDKAIAKTDQIIQKTELLKQGLMKELLTRGINHKKFKLTKLGSIPESWDAVSLDSCADVSTGTTPSTSIPHYYQGKNPFIKTTSISNNRITQSNVHIADEAIKIYRLKIYPPGTILMAMYGEGKTRGQVALLEIYASTTQNAAAIIPNQKIDSEFLWFYLLSQYLSLRSSGVQGQISHLNLSFVKNFLIPLPSKDEQIKIAAVLKSVETKLLSEKRHLQKLITLKNGLMKDIFSQKVQIN